MPSDNEITLWLQSYDLHTVLEHPYSANVLNRWQTRYGIETLEVSEQSLAKSVLISKIPSSLFWICYSVNPREQDLALFYYFKITINGEPFVSWGVGQKDGWKGKIMFSLVPGLNKDTQNSVLEKRALCFGTGDEPSNMVVRVYRSYARKKIARPRNRSSAISRDGLHDGSTIRYVIERRLLLNNSPVLAGRAHSKHPREFYKYALIDSLSRPYTMMRYICMPKGLCQFICLTNEQKIFRI